MTLEQAKEIIAARDTSTKAKKDEFLIALKIVSGNAFVRQN
jgi:hypothetical protein